MKRLNFAFASVLLLAFALNVRTQINPANARTVQTTTGATLANATSLSLAPFTNPITIGNSILVLCGSGNFNTANWNAAFTDNVGNVYKALGSPVANSTTQAAFAFQAAVTRVAATVIGTVTLSGSNSAATALACTAYELTGVPSQWLTNGSVTGQGSAGTANPMQFGTIPISYQDELVFVGVAAASGTCSLTAYPNNFYTLDTTLTPATSNVTTFCTGSSLAGNSSLRIDSITLSGSVANAEIAVTVRDETSAQINCNVATFQGTRNTANSLANCGQITERGYRFIASSNPGVGVQATVNKVAGSNNRLVVDSVCFSGGSTTAPVATQLNITISGSIQGTLWSHIVVVLAVAGQNVPLYCTPYIGAMSDYSETITIQWSSLLANLFEAISASIYSVD